MIIFKHYLAQAEAHALWSAVQWLLASFCRLNNKSAFFGWRFKIFLLFIWVSSSILTQDLDILLLDSSCQMLPSSCSALLSIESEPRDFFRFEPLVVASKTCELDEENFYFFDNKEFDDGGACDELPLRACGCELALLACIMRPRPTSFLVCQLACLLSISTRRTQPTRTLQSLWYMIDVNKVLLLATRFARGWK